MAGRGKRKGGDGNGFEDWGGYMAAKISKLENQYSDEFNGDAGKDSNIFASISIFVNGYTTPTAEELKRIMLCNGGTYHHYYNSRSTTHIIASNLCDAKIKKLRGDEKFVRPEWIVECLKSKTLLDCKPYLLYTTNVDKGQQRLELGSVPKPLQQQNTDCQHQEIEMMIAETNNNSTNEANKSEITSIPSGKSSKQGDMKRAGEDDFLSEFYNRSRLHHISTMGANFKRLVSQLRENSDGSFPGLEELKTWQEGHGCSGDFKSDEPVLMHIDMDCFFVSVGLRNHPELRGKPVVVTHAKADSKPQPRRDGSNREFEFDCYKEHWIKKSKFANEGESTSSLSDVFPRLQDMDETCSMSEIACASYEARAAGIYNGMFMGAALKLCPSLVAIPYDFDGYQEVATLLYQTVASYTLDIEAVSCDELYADISSILQQSGLSPAEFATHLREVILQKTRCNASVGMGPSMLIARLSTKKAKPNGQFHTSRAVVEEFMRTHKVEDLPGVGRSSAHRLHAMGANTCADMQTITLGKLQHEFGQKQGQTLYNLCRGDDKRTLKTGHIRKSISADINYGIRFANEQEMYKFAHELATEVSKRMEEIKVRGRLLTLKLKIRAKDAPVETAKFMGHGVCDSISRSVAMAAATRDANTIHKDLMVLLRQLKADFRELRGMGVQMSKLVVDNVKGKQLQGQKTLLNFVARSKAPVEIPPAPPKELERVNSDVLEEGRIPREDKKESEEETEVVADRSLFELPSASQIDSSVFEQLPDDLKTDILKEYKRKGISISGGTSNEVSDEPVAGPSRVVTIEPAASALPDQPVSYDGINQISDIDSSYWSALPDEIKQEIERDIQRRKVEATTSPTKNWSDIFRGKQQQSPSKVVRNNKTATVGKRKTNKSPEKAIAAPSAKVTAQKNSKSPQVFEKAEEVIPFQETRKEDPSLGGATTLPEVRQVLTEWFSSTNFPEDEDKEAVCNYLVSLVSHRQLDKVEPIILFLKRWASERNNCWKKVVEDIISQTQLYVIQHYNAPLKLP